MRIAGHTMGTPDLPLAEALRLFRDAGLDAAEVVWQDGYRSGLPERADGPAIDEAARLQKELGVDVVCLTAYMSAINSLDDAERRHDVEQFHACIDAAARLGCGLIRVYAGSYLPDRDAPLRDAKWDRLVETLRALGPIAHRQGVTLCVETHFNTMTATAQETADLMRAVDTDGVGVLYDQPNLDFAHEEPFAEAYPLLRPWLIHVHVKDFVFTDPDAPFRADAVEKVDADTRTVRSRVVGEGVMEWTPILRALRDDGYDGFLSLEYEYRWHRDDLPPPEVGIPRSAERVRQLLAELDASEVPTGGGDR